MLYSPLVLLSNKPAPRLERVQENGLISFPSMWPTNVDLSSSHSPHNENTASRHSINILLFSSIQHDILHGISIFFCTIRSGDLHKALHIASLYVCIKVNAICFFSFEAEQHGRMTESVAFLVFFTTRQPQRVRRYLLRKLLFYWAHLRKHAFTFLFQYCHQCALLIYEKRVLDVIDSLQFPRYVVFFLNFQTMGSQFFLNSTRDRWCWRQQTRADLFKMQSRVKLRRQLISVTFFFNFRWLLNGQAFFLLYITDMNSNNWAGFPVCLSTGPCQKYLRNECSSRYLFPS